MEELIQLVAAYLSGRPREELVRLPQIYRALAGREAVEIDEVLDRLRAQRLVRATFQGDAVQLTPDGVTATADGCVPELVLGQQYITERLRPAVVHVIVQTQDHDEAGGSGFFCARTILGTSQPQHTLSETTKSFESKTMLEKWLREHL